MPSCVRVRVARMDGRVRKCPGTQTLARRCLSYLRNTGNDRSVTRPYARRSEAGATHWKKPPISTCLVRRSLVRHVWNTWPSANQPSELADDQHLREGSERAESRETTEGIGIKRPTQRRAVLVHARTAGTERLEESTIGRCWQNLWTSAASPGASPQPAAHAISAEKTTAWESTSTRPPPACRDGAQASDKTDEKGCGIPPHAFLTQTPGGLI
ncbi:unnamed protein product [Lampetra planeri]